MRQTEIIRPATDEAAVPGAAASGPETSGLETLRLSVEKSLQSLEAALSSRLAPRLGLALAIVLLAGSAATWTWRMIAPTSAVPASLPGAATKRAATDLRTLVTAGLFGPDAEANRLPEENIGDLPVTDLNLKLVGVIAAGKSSLALISVDGAISKPFHLGAEITGGAVLDAVFSNRVTLRRAGRLEALPLSGAPSGRGSARASTISGTGIASLGDRHFAVSRETITARMSGPAALMQARAEIAENGIKLSDVDAGSVFEDLGLKSGTVIHALNGQAVRSPADLLALYAKMKDSSSVDLDVTVDGQDQRLRYEIQ